MSQTKRICSRETTSWTNRRSVIRGLIGLLPLSFGGLIYLLWRSESLRMFMWVNRLELDGIVAIARNLAEPYGTVFPGWFYYSLPQALWLLSGLLIADWIWRGTTTLDGDFWGVAFVTLASSFEIGQIFDLVPGDFDILDAALLGLAAVSAALLIQRRSSKERWRTSDDA